MDIKNPLVLRICELRCNIAAQVERERGTWLAKRSYSFSLSVDPWLSSSINPEKQSNDVFILASYVVGKGEGYLVLFVGSVRFFLS